MTMTSTHYRVLQVCKDIGDPLLNHIVDALSDVPAYQTRTCVRELVQWGHLRMKDDDIDHDWTYRLNELGRQAIATA